MKTAHQNVPYPQEDQDVANKKYVDDNAGGGGGSGGITTLTFRPGSGDSGPVIWSDFNALYDNALAQALSDGGGQCTILIDDSNESPAVLDPGAGNISYDLTGVRLVGIDPHRQVPLDVLAGSGESNTLTITGASYFEGLHVKSVGNDTAFDAQNDQEIVLKRTTFEGAGEFVYDFLSVTGCILHLGDESRLQRNTNAAIRVNGNALTVHVTGNNATIDNLGISGFVGGSIDVYIGSSSARVDKQQDILTASFTMQSSSGFWNGDPNTKLTATMGTLVSDETTGSLWENTDGATAWSLFAAGLSGLELDYQTPPQNGPSPSMQFQALAVTTDNSKVYVSGQGGTDPTWWFTTSNNKWVTGAPAPIAMQNVRQFVMHPSGTKMYVLSGADLTTVYIVDLTTNTVTGTVAGLPGGVFYYSTMAIQPGTNELWVHYDAGPNWIARVDTSTDTYITSFTAATGNAYAMTFNPSGTKMYYLGADTLVFAPRFHIYDATTYTLITSISDTPVYRGLIALPDGSEVWVTIDGSFPTNSSIVRYSTTTDSIVGSPILTSQDSGAPSHLAVKSDSSKVYALLNSGDIDVVTVASHTVTNTIAMSGEYAGDLAINPASTFLYASKTQGVKPYWVKVVSTASETVVATVDNSSVAEPAPVAVGSFDTIRVIGAKVADDGGGQGSISLPVLYDVGLTSYSNIKANRSGAEISINDQTKVGITNFGAGSTASNNYAAIGGGQNNNATGISSTVPGGDGNVASGESSIAFGWGSVATGDGTVAGNASSIDGDYAAGFNYGSTDPGAEACFVANDGTVGQNSYGCVAVNGGAVDQNGNYNLAEGSAFIDSDCQYCHAEGQGGYIAPNLRAAHAEGRFSDVEADNGHAEGESCIVNVGAYAAHAEGGGCEASGPNAHAEGTSTTASGYYSHAEGGATLAEGEGSHAEGDGGWAQADWCHTQGSRAHGFWEISHNMGHGYSGGFGGGDGTSQSGDVGWRLYPISGPSNTAPLRTGVNSGGATALVLQDGRAYDFVVTAVINGTDVGPTYKTRTIKIKFNARCVAGVATIAGSGTNEEYGDAATWTLTPSAVANTIVLTFDTGLDTHTCYVSANMQYVQQRFL